MQQNYSDGGQKQGSAMLKSVNYAFVGKNKSRLPN